MKDYIVAIAGFFYGTYYAKDAVLKLHPRQAQYELLLGNLVEKATVVSSPEPPAPAVEAVVPRAAEPRPKRSRRLAETSRLG